MFIPKISYFYVDRALSIFGKLLTCGVAPLVSIAIYVFTALALYTIAKRRGIAAPWLAWVPVARLWVLGSLSDQYRYLTQGQIRHKRIMLLVWKGVSWVLTGGIVVSAIAAIAGASVGAILTVLCLALVVVCAAIVYVVLYFMALYDVYASCDPQNAAVYLVLSVFFGFLVPVFLFLSRNLEKGMPPRKETAENAASAEGPEF